MFLVQVSLLLIDLQGFVDLQVSALVSHWLEDGANITPTPEKNNQYSATANYSKCIQTAIQSTFVNKVSTCVSRDDKNKQITIIKPT